MNRKELLENSIKCVCGERDEQYGSPENNFSVIANLWTIYFRAAHISFNSVFKPEDVGMMLALLKIARIATGKPKADNYIDLAGYAACAGEIATGGNEYD